MQLLIKRVIDRWCRISNQSTSFPGDDDYEDRIYNYAANEILELPGSEGMYEGLNHEQVVAIKEKVEKEYPTKITEAKNEFKKLQENCKAIRDGINKVFDNDKNFNQLLNEAIKDCRRVKKNFNAYYKEANNIISDRKSEPAKYDVDIYKMIKKLSFIFIIFVNVGAYLYIWLLFKLFAFNMYGYFTLTDYVTASFNKLTYPLLYSATIIALILAGHVNRKRRPRQLIELHKKQDKFIFPAAFLTLILMALTAFVYKTYDQLFIITGLVLIAILPYILNRFVKTSFELVTLVILFVIYISQVLSTSYLEYSHIINAKRNNVVIYFDDGKIIEKKSLVFILNNSEYYFYYDNTTKNVVVYPKDKINYVINKSS